MAFTPDSRFEQSFELLEGYTLGNAELLSLPEYSVDLVNKLVSIEAVDQYYTIILDFQRKEYQVELNTKYLDGHLPESSQAFWGYHNDPFLQTYEIADRQPVLDVDMLTKVVTLAPVLQDQVIALEFEKKEYRIDFTIKYLDDSTPEATETYRAIHQDGFSQTYAITEGYRVANADQLPAGVILDEGNNTVTIDSVTRHYDIVLEFEKMRGEFQCLWCFCQ